MARRKTEPNISELVEFLVQGLDRRTRIGRRAYETIMGMAEKGDPNLGYLRSLKLKLGTDDITDIRFLEEVGYERDVDTQCVCGNAITTAYRFRYGPRMKDRKKKNRVRVPILLGSTHRSNTATMLEEWGDNTLNRQITEGPKEQEEKLEEMLARLPASMLRRLASLGTDVEQLEKVLSFQHAYAILHGDETGLRYDLDPGRNRNPFNWFRFGIKAEEIDDREVRDIWYKLHDAAHLLREDERITLLDYSFEYRYLDTKAVIGDVKDDLLFLSKLPKDHKWARKYDRVDLDKKYELPETRFRPAKDFYGKKKKTIRDVLNQVMITTIEAIGIHQQFPDIEKTRMAINRETAQRYGKGRTWDYLLEHIKPEFEDMKKDLRGEFERYGAIKQIYGLTKDEYLTLKGFFERCDIGKRSRRTNYLRNYSINDFLEVAPKIVLAGRKIRYTKEVVNATGADKTSIMRKDYAPIEDVSEKFNKLTGIEGRSLDDVLDLLEHAEVKEKTFNAFQRDDLPEIRRMLKYGIIDRTYLRPEGLKTLRRNYDLVRSKGIDKLTDDQKKAQEGLRKRYQDQGLVYKVIRYRMPRGVTVYELDEALRLEYADEETRRKIGRVHDSVERLVEKLRKDKRFTFKQLKEDRKKAESFYGEQVLMMLGEASPNLQCVEFDADYLVERYEDPMTRWTIKYFDPKKTRTYAGLQKMTEAELAMARTISSYDVTSKLFFSISSIPEKGDVWATRETIRTIEGLHQRAVEQGFLK